MQSYNSSFYAKWTRDHIAVVYGTAVGYLLLVYAGHSWMKDREPRELRRPLIVWNFCLAVFSIAGFYYTGVPFLDDLVHKGFHHTLCDPTCFEGMSGFWMLLFACSKLIEFGDTAFILLRKQKLIFLHWYHHALTFLLAWKYFAETAAFSQWIVVMNYCVHSLMYSYYTLRAARVWMPHFLQVSLTVLQILQMVIGCYMLVELMFVLTNNSYPSCHSTKSAAYITFAMYFSYAGLFLNFFVKTYVLGKKKKAQ
eukprot:m.129151 g.129151  ORF g.129151 m.129151 type:complete len:253 (+) comp37962_c0_seq2:45-803(+)